MLEISDSDRVSENMFDISESRNPSPRVHTSMGAFGAPSMKPSMLMGNVGFLNALKRAPTDDDRVRFAEHSVVDVDSQGGVTGRPELKATQEYPIEYCETVAEEWVQWNSISNDHDVSSPDASDSESDLYDENSDAWSDAGLEDLEELMELPHNRMPPGTFAMFSTSRR